MSLLTAMSCISGSQINKEYNIMKLHILIISILSFALLSIQANAQETPFHTGPVFS